MRRRPGRGISTTLALASLVGVAVFVPASPPRARANPVLVVESTANSGSHTLRDAMATANSVPGADRIEFDLDGPAPHVIAPTSGLPGITETLVIDGTSQPGFSAATHKPVVVLDGINAGNAGALSIGGPAAGGTQIRGLEIIRFQFRAITVDTAPNVVIAGNYIGTDGNSDLSNGTNFMTFLGVVESFGECRNLRIGGTTAADRNVIVTSHGAAAYLSSIGGTRFLGNYVGTNAAGTAGIAGGSGVYAETDDVVIGGTARGAGNVLAAGVRGVYIFGPGEISILGNRIGTNAAGTAAIPNSFGIQLQSGTNTTIGGTSPRARNLVSGNDVGISLESSSDNLIQGNWIGTNAAGTAAIANRVGVSVFGGFSPAVRNRIGGTVAGAGNVISGNGDGVMITSGSDNVVKGNRIGTGPNGTSHLGNTGAGVTIRPGTGNVVGGLTPGAGNLIAFNGGAGVAVGDDGTSEHNVIRGNDIHGNGGLGIDLQPGGAAGVTPNDGDDSDTGPNALQNFPVITDATSGPGGTTISATLHSSAFAPFTVDFYAVDSPDAAGNGEGRIYVGTLYPFTDPGGTAVFTGTLPLVGANYLTATTTRVDTSEFSPAVLVHGGGGFRFSRTTFSTTEGAGKVTVTVQRVGGSDGVVSIGYSTSNGTARTPGDYGAKSARLRFGDGQTSRSFTVPIVNDTRHEPAERFTVRLADPRGGAALSTPTGAKVSIAASD